MKILKRRIVRVPGAVYPFMIEGLAKRFLRAPRWERLGRTEWFGTEQLWIEHHFATMEEAEGFLRPVEPERVEVVKEVL